MFTVCQMGQIITDFPYFYIVFVREKCGYLSPPLLAPKMIGYLLKRDFYGCTWCQRECLMTTLAFTLNLKILVSL